MSENLDLVRSINAAWERRQSGASVDQRRYFAVTVDRARIMRVRMFSERGNALKAAGPEE